jgi:pilus assembly protein CpaF
VSAAAELLTVSVRSAGASLLSRSFPAGLDVVVGRDASCHLVLSGTRVSRRHLRLCLSETGIRVTDLSANGTQVAGELLRGGTRAFEESAVSLSVADYEVVLERHRARPVDARSRRRVHERLLDVLDLRRRALGERVTDALRAEVRARLEELVSSPEFEVAPEQRPLLVRELEDEALGLGPLEALLADPEVSEVMVVDARTIYAERSGQLELTGRAFTDDEAVRSVIERIVTPLGRRIDESSPMVDARLPDGSRVNAVIPPLALRGPCITIRKFPSRRLTLSDLVARGSLSERMACFLTRSVALRKNIIISGGTGSGKTTLLNVLSAAIGERERVVTIEDAAELCLAQPHVVGLESKPPNLEGQGEFTIRALLKNALRMRPDRIVVGECRGGEALDMLQAMNTGHDGSMTTTHASTPAGALERIETLCLLAGVELPLSALRRQLASSVHLIVQQSRLSSGARRITSVTELVGVGSDGRLETRELFRLEGDRHVATGHMPSYLAELERLAGAGEEVF